MNKEEENVRISDATFKTAMNNYAEDTAIHFLEWTASENWKPYDSHETWINTEQGNRVLTTKKLFEEYKKQNP